MKRFLMLLLTAVLLCCGLLTKDCEARDGTRSNSIADIPKTESENPLDGMPLHVNLDRFKDELPARAEKYEFFYQASAMNGIKRLKVEGTSCTLLGSEAVLAHREAEYLGAVHDALARIPEACRPKTPVTILSVQRIHITECPSGWDPSTGVQGLFFEWKDGLCIAFPENGFEPGLIAHELFHVYVREKKLLLPLWLEEGVAELFETKEGFQKAHFETLRTQGALSSIELERYVPPSLSEKQVRASAWAVAYSWCVLEKKPLPELLALKQFPDSAEASSLVLKRMK